MKKIASLVLLGVVVYLGSLVLNLPARIAYGLARDVVPDSVELFGLEGSVFRGGGRAVLLGKYPIRHVTWEFEPASLLLGRLEYTLRMRFDGGRLAAGVAADPLMRVTLSDVSGAIPAELLQAAMPQGPLVYGQLEPAIETLVIEDGALSRAKGRLLAKSLSYRGDGILPLGDFVAGTDADGSPVAVGIGDSGGPLRLNGQLVVASDGSYQFEAVAGAREPSPELTNLLAQIGTPNQDGQYSIQFGGQIP